MRTLICNETTNKCSAFVTFKRGDEIRRVELCSIQDAFDYVNDVVLAKHWVFISVERGENTVAQA